MAISLSEEQKDVVRKVVSGIDNHQYQTLGGYAGTGKTTLINTLARAKPNYAVCAYTGKATNRLRTKGIRHASTIHSLIYRPWKDEEGVTIWGLASRYELTGIEGFIVDEASMVSYEIHKDLLSFNLPIIYVGDHGQLEPIGGTKFNLMGNPMYKLEEVHRNAGEIAHFAEHLRKGGIARQFKGTQGVQVVKDSAVQPRHLANTDQIIVAYNKTRVKVNNTVREEKGIQYAYIAIGEKVMCLRNNRQLRLFNGMQGVVTKIIPGNDKDEKFYMDFTSGGEQFERIQYDPDQFGKETNEYEYSNKANPFDYAYAITCHKAQGDEWDNVIVYEQICDKWDHKRWAYTAASRAKRGLVWIESARYIPNYLM